MLETVVDPVQGGRRCRHERPRPSVRAIRPAGRPGTAGRRRDSTIHRRHWWRRGLQVWQGRRQQRGTRQHELRRAEADAEHLVGMRGSLSPRRARRSGTAERAPAARSGRAVPDRSRRQISSFRGSAVRAIATPMTARVTGSCTNTTSRSLSRRHAGSRRMAAVVVSPLDASTLATRSRLARRPRARGGGRRSRRVGRRSPRRLRRRPAARPASTRARSTGRCRCALPRNPCRRGSSTASATASWGRRPPRG